ncbi:tRNA wybutosine-synthesizing protein 2/3/4 [Thalictrum thalictroides]|uniref:tRNA wybutosine-synthesizing protein 2/3/4 n=1 Tax=Thalictrum thalictroides TaxID=46969 RepID=A0A7J6WW39_THATH|nr:tRNA wybutosine-synthesizing protein 2/3/4 [Thalictrum thalictroides]
MEFEKRKAATLSSISSTEIDKSPKGTLDIPILPLLKALNLHPSYFTTSSCSGRISILSQPSLSTTTTTTVKKKAKGGTWVFITHEPADPNAVIDLLFPPPEAVTHNPIQDGELVFRFEPFILAVECKDVASAQSLVATAISCGFRESGITSVHKRVIIAIRCSIRLEVPLGSIGNMMVSPDYVRYLVSIANEKMEMNRKRTECFLQVLETKLLDNQVLSNGMINTKKNVLMDTEEQCVCSDECDGNGDLSQLPVENCDLEREDSNAQLGLLSAPGCSISVVKMLIVGEPIDKLFLWGHSACTINNSLHQKILIFGGFGGVGRHARRNDILMLDPLYGTLELISVEGPPSPRLGHTSSLVGEDVFVIGGRGDPTNILNDVWVFNTNKNEWKLQESSGSVFHPRHRHAAAVVGSKIYVFGGLNKEIIYSSMYVLDTEHSQWIEIDAKGEWPCARHSHALVEYDTQLYMFGGYDGEKALCDLYSFDTIMCLWKKQKTTGRPPLARFSHSMFVYKNYLGIVGGCPVRQHYEEMALLDLRFGSWKHVILSSVGKDLFVRSTSNVVGDDLVIIGGGASCYAFGTKFSEPMKISLLRPTIFFDTINPRMNEMHSACQPKMIRGNGENSILVPVDNKHTLTESCNFNYKTEVHGESLDIHKDATQWERLGDIVVLPMTSFRDPLWNSIREELWPTVAISLNTYRLARQGRIASTGTRDSTLDMLVGDDGWVDHRENGILYSFDATKCMFSWGNLSEKLRMSRLNCEDEVIVDLFAGIGYFVLPFLVRAKAKMVYACEWNPHALQALRRNVQSNAVADRCVVLEGDNRATAPKGVADRVCLGLLPSSEGSWVTAVRALRIEGGMLHVHGNAKDSEESIWSDHVAKTIHDIAKSEGFCWEVSVQHLERVKWYGPHIRHLVADVRCKQV